MSELDPILDSLFRAPFAPAPSLGQLERRRVQRRRHRTTARLAAAAGALAILLAVTRAQSLSTNTVHTINGGDHTPPTVTTSPSQPGVPPDEQGAAPGLGGSNDAAAVASPAGATPLPAGSTTTTPGATGCAVESAADAVDVTTPVGGAGLGGTQRACDFTATQAGGYLAHGTWEVEIYRGKEYFNFKNNKDLFACGPMSTIQPGDHVVLTLTYGSDAAADHQYVRAGPDQHC